MFQIYSTAVRNTSDWGHTAVGHRGILLLGPPEFLQHSEYLVLTLVSLHVPDLLNCRQEYFRLRTYSYRTQARTTVPPTRVSPAFWIPSFNSGIIICSRFTQLPSGVLQIEDIQLSDTGAYYCSAHQSFSSILKQDHVAISSPIWRHSKEAFLTVNASGKYYTFILPRTIWTQWKRLILIMWLPDKFLCRASCQHLLGDGGQWQQPVAHDLVYHPFLWIYLHPLKNYHSYLFTIYFLTF